MNSQLWKDSKRDNAQCLIDWLISQREDSGWPMDWLNRIAFAELSASALPTDLDQWAIMRSLNQMVRENDHSVVDFERIFKELRQEKAASLNRDKSNWKFFIPLGITLGSDLPKSPRIKILSKHFTFLGLSSVNRQLSKEERKTFLNPNYLTIETGVTITEIPQVFLSVSGRGASWLLAWREVAPAFDALRGILEFSFGYGGWRLSSDGISPRRKVPHPLWMMAKKSEAPIEWVRFITDEDKPSGVFDLTNERFASIRKNARFLCQESDSKSIESLIADCLRLYSQAMDARFRYECFLGFWQLAEAITRAETFGGSTDKVVARIAWHGEKTGLIGSGYRETLHALSKKRNDIVHRGIHEVEDEDVNILKLACEVALAWLVRQRKSLPTKTHLDQFYRLREVNSTELQALRDCIKHIESASSN